MDIEVLLTDLASMHPRLLWEEIIIASVGVLGSTGFEQPFRFELTVEDLPNFGSETIQFAIGAGDIAADQVNRLQRTYEPSRLVEMAAIAIAGLGLYHGGGHEIQDVALRGTGADYLVDETNHLLEIAGRSRRSDLNAAWEQRWQRLSDRLGEGFYLCIVEFETPAGRLAFAH